jgi:hypothetical protein
MVAFEQKMFAISKELVALKDKTNEHRINSKKEARVLRLEQERDWFRKECLSLQEICKKLKASNAEL